MNLSAADYLLTRFAAALPGAMKLLGDVESEWLGDALEARRIDRPVFITGLARSGTTLLLDMLAGLPGVATHRYRDFPFVFVPVAWNRLQGRLAKSRAPVERPHRDGIRITKDSPEAFEEPIWAHFFPGIHDPHATHRLTREDRDPRFDAFFRQHLQKLLLLCGGRRYVSKGNYNVTRIEYLADLLPDARFVVPVRHPVAQVESLMRQHRLFSDYSAKDPRVPQYMRAAGHYEFGPQRVPVNVHEEDAREIAEAWTSGDDDVGYAVTWRSVYMHVRALRKADADLRRRIEFVRYEDLCQAPEETLRRIARFCELEAGIDALLARAADISPRKRGASRLTDAQRACIWSAAAETAESFGYGPRRAAA